VIAGPLVLGLLSALGFGIADYIAGSAARLIGVRRTALFTQTVGWLALSLFIMSVPSRGAVAGTAHGWQWIAAVASILLNFIGSLALLRAFSIGRASLIAPLVATYPVVTIVLDLAVGTPMRGLRLLGILVCLVGAPLAAAKGDGAESSSRDGVIPAIVAAMAFGLGFWIQGHFAIPAFGAVRMLWMLFGAGAVIMGVSLLARRAPLLPSRAALPLLIVQALANLLGYGSFAVGMATGAVTLVTVLSILAAAVTALLGLSLRGERLNLWQSIGVITVLAGVVLLRVGP
jgi:drug/metabolite transporter (DMT)-like permease